ncbi:MAG: succinate dehydrogenase, cytochrome b556 subunit [Anaerolineae bacterium]
MTSLVLTLTETLRYRGAVGQWSWVMHRLTGLGVVLFLILHVVDTSWAVFYPDLYVRAIAAYQSPLFTLGEFGLVFAVVYHAYNGLRIIVFDFKPQWWRHQQEAAKWVVVATLATLVPVFLIMFNHVLNHYGSNPDVLGLDRVLLEQLPFVIGMVIALVIGIGASFAVGMITGGKEETRTADSRIERFWWSYMRLSGLLIIPLVFGHLAMMHLIQGVFDITARNYEAVGAVFSQVGVNATGTSVEFVADRWNTFVAGVAIWRIYDFALLLLAVVHGFNGLRYVFTDYTMSNPMLRRGLVYTCIIGAAILLAVGSGMLWATIPETSVRMAEEAMRNLHP